MGQLKAHENRASPDRNGRKSMNVSVMCCRVLQDSIESSGQKTIHGRSHVEANLIMTYMLQTPS